MKPSAKTHTNLGSALAAVGRLDEAISEFSEAVRLDPALPAARRNLDHARSLRRATARRPGLDGRR